MSSSSSSHRSLSRRSVIPRPVLTADAPLADSTIVEPREPTFAANAQLSHLEEAVHDWRFEDAAKRRRSEPGSTPDPTPDDTLDPSPILAPSRGVSSVTVIKSSIAVAVAVALGWMPVQRLLATTSAEAVVNARIITVRAPIAGEITMANSATDIGTLFQADQTILTIRNSRADTNRLIDLARQRDQLKTSIGSLEAKKAFLQASLKELEAQQERFRLGRIQQIEQRVREAEADIASAEAQYAVSAAALKRASHLRGTDAVSQAYLDKAQGDARVGEQAIRAQVERKKGVLVELDAARKGTYVGDSYNDTPQSAQRKMEVALELSDVEARLAGSQIERSALDTALAAEQSRQSEMSRVDMRSTVDGRVWEMLTAPGEHVNAGQDLVKLIDCGSAIVTASVSESDYEKLAIGQAATFKPRDGGPELHGMVVGLNGLAAVESNSAIQQNALSREPYHVTVKFPELSKSFDCRVGRSGLVKFDTGNSVLAGSLF